MLDFWGVVVVSCPQGPDPSKTPEGSPCLVLGACTLVESHHLHQLGQRQQENITKETQSENTCSINMQETGTQHYPLIIPPFKGSQSYTSSSNLPIRRSDSSPHGSSQGRRIIARILPLLIALRKSAFNSLEVASIRIGKDCKGM